MICSEGAFLRREDYTLAPVPKSTDPVEQDKLAAEWKANVIAKYPELLLSYDLLLDCWYEYAKPVK